MTTPPGDPVGWPDVVIGIGQATLLGLAAGAVLLARGAIRAEGARRGLNVIWDVIAFWPRSVHPFVPPPYAQEVVPALVRRICWHLGIPDPLRDTSAEPGEETAETMNDDPAAAVVVAAHSQGSLISLAALLWPPEEARDRVRWLTFGSQLRQQFPRAFPHNVRVESLRYAQLQHGWLSLYRDTDPIAGPVDELGHTWDWVPTLHRLEGLAGTDLGRRRRRDWAPGLRPRVAAARPGARRRSAAAPAGRGDPRPFRLLAGRRLGRRPRRRAQLGARPQSRASSATGSRVSSASTATPATSDTTRCPVSASRHEPSGSSSAVSRQPPAASPTGSRVATATAPPRSKATTWSAAGPAAASGR